jgi:enoyl-CoA hydratase/carnithine racemase
MTDVVLREDNGRITTLILNRPDALNAITMEMFEQLRAHIDDIASAGTAIGCIILCGNGRAFSAGHDLTDIEGGGELENANYQAATLEALAGLPQPTIAAVHGYCFTGALEVALATDLIIVDEKTILADTHTQWGLTPVWGMTQRLPRRIGQSRAKDLMFSSRRVGASEAYSIGLVDKVVGEGQLVQETQAYAESIVVNSPYSQTAIKTILAKTDGLRIDDGLDYEYTNSPGACKDMLERVTKFTKK